MAYPQAQMCGIEFSWPLRFLAALRCPWAHIWQGDIWQEDWSDYDLVYLFQRPETMSRAVAKARPEIKLDGLSTDTLAGMFLAVTSEGAASTARNDGLASAHRAAHGDDTNLRNDGDDDLDPAAELNRNTQNTFERRSRGDKEGGR